MIIGFSLIFIAASGGAFIALDTNYRFLEGNPVPAWREVLQTSSHGHTSLFGMIHILLGLTLPYSKLHLRLKIFQTIGIGAGSLALGPMMLIRASSGPSSEFQVSGLMIGLMLSLALASICIHVYGLTLSLLKR
jgi:hypothetical protein